MNQQPLSDVRVLDLTWHIAGPYCTKLLADCGADVIKVERPGSGDPSRREGPFFEDDPHPEKGGLFLHLNTNKKGISLNLNTDTGKSIFKELVRDVDILVESFSPRVMPGLGLDYQCLEKINPRLVMTSISNFGQSGPYRDFKASELVISGMGSPMKSTGQPDREPLKLAGNVLQYQSGAVASVATMIALFGSRVTGEGQHVDVSIFETQLGSMDRRSTFLVGHQYTGDVAQRTGRGGIVAACPQGIYPSSDGYWDIYGGVMWWPQIFQLLGSPEELADPVYGTVEGQVDPERQEKIEAVFYPWSLSRDKYEIWKAALEAHCCAAPLFTTEELMHDPHFQERGAFTDIEHPVVGKVRYPGVPFHLSDAPPPPKRPAPLLGEHNEEVYGGLGYSKEDLIRLRGSGII